MEDICRDKREGVSGTMSWDSGADSDVGRTSLGLVGVFKSRLESERGVTATGVLDILDTKSDVEFSSMELKLGVRCQRPRTPSTAFRKPVEPAVNVREMASRVGASCCSNLSSWMPSASRRPISATTDGFSLHGCLICAFIWVGNLYIN